LGYDALLLGLLLATVTPAISADDRPTETIDARTMGTSTQMGQNVGVKVIITQFSTPQNRQVLVDAFKKGQSAWCGESTQQDETRWTHCNHGNAWLGTQLHRSDSHANRSQDPLRHQRQIRFGEAYNNGPSTAYELTDGWRI
jgi:hypothetical protein